MTTDNTAPVVSLLEVRYRRQRTPMYFPSPVDALEYCFDRLEALDEQIKAAGTTSIPTRTASNAFTELALILSACLTAHENPHSSSS
ncbi:hypothetical protein FE697_007250 [Mumia zhuanghuii]|uniref:Uncharacterized protein n=2 Tax=Mumia TaxID=1546255 RepID=A0ABW1QMF2_9ACTN|nr:MULTISPECIES: hypothetical protein [Mumia]KAA1423400.1 hypothetical protein FE697_007250 [Mumia zhuanghuii]